MKLSYKFIPVIAGLPMLLGGLVYADVDNIGKQEFRYNCAVCHGVGGTGNGPAVDVLKQAPPDLTGISQRHGGSFPYKQVYQWIEDPAGIRAHGSHDMPIWGARYSQAIIDKYGPYDTMHSGEVQARILELVFYLANIQK